MRVIADRFLTCCSVLTCDRRTPRASRCGTTRRAGRGLWFGAFVMSTGAIDLPEQLTRDASNRVCFPG